MRSHPRQAGDLARGGAHENTAAVDARSDADIQIMARTDARAVHGFDEALTRCEDFAAEGADIVFLEAPESEDEMRRFCSAMPRPCMANMVPGGKTPILPPQQLKEIGYKLAVYPVMLLSSSIAAMQTALTALRPESNLAPPAAVSFSELQSIVGFPDYWQRETKYQVKD
jgi:2-methylisocitrate lyase-like PEP mutase family enzyme